MRDFTVVETRTVGKFNIELAWTYDTLTLDHVFETEEDIAIHAKRCNEHTDTHYVARVRALYNGTEMGSAWLGSCYAYNCTPADDFEKEIDGYLGQLIEEAIEEANINCKELQKKLQEDFQ